MTEVVAVVGAQFGSEAKGAIVNQIADQFDVHVRTGAPNAGHTLYHQGEKWVMRSVPCGWVNKSAALIIGPGALLDLHLLREEVAALDAAGFKVSERLFIDHRAGLIDPMWHLAMEGGVDGRAHQQIGSTGEGVGPARMAKIARGTFDGAWAQFEQVQSHADEVREFAAVVDTSALVNDMLDAGSSVLLEGAQGSGLSLTTGPWPYCTSSDTNAGQLAVDAGISPSLVTKTILVARTFPIRVAGNSGPLYGETTWEALGLEPERTTVTKKIRRVGAWDDSQIRRAITLNRPAEIALTFVNYLNKADWGAAEMDSLSADTLDFIERVEDLHQVAVTYVGTSPWTVIERAYANNDPVAS